MIAYEMQGTLSRRLPMGLLSRSCVLSLFALASLPPQLHGGELRFPAELLGQEVWYRISTRQIESTPEWLDMADSPPFPARKAMNLATVSLPTVTSQVIGERADRNEWKWSKMCLEEFAGRWFWVVTFKRVLTNGAIGSGVQEECHIVILMNGKVVMPTFQS